MKLLLTADNFDGVWTYVINLAKGLKNSGFDVRVAIIGNELTYHQKQEISFTSWYFFRSKLEWMRNPWNDIEASGKWLLSLAESIQPDVVHLNSYSYGNLDWKIPVVITAHSCVLSWYEAVNKTDNIPDEWNEYLSRVTLGIRSADVVITPSYDMMKAVEKFYHPAGKKLVIYNGTETSNYIFGRKEEYVFCMGRLWDEAKNLRLVLEAARKIRCRIYIAGGTAEITRKLPANVHFLGQLTRQQAANWLSAAAVYLLPVRYEPFGYTFLEAALSGCALVAGDISSMREIWADAAVYADPDKSDALARTVNVLMSMPEWRLHLAMKAHTRAVSEYNADIMVSRYKLLYNNLMSTGFKKLIKYQEQ